MSEWKATCRGREQGGTCAATVMMRQLDPSRAPHPYDHPPRKCATCKGTGKIENPPQLALMGDPLPTTRPCPRCKGAGVVWVSHFKTCPDRQMFTGGKDGEEHEAI